MQDAHLLIAGSTGSGKSVCVNSIIMSLLFRSSPEDVKLLLIDPKVVELAEYNGIPHLLMPVVTEPRKAAGALGSAVQEMERRYRLFAENNVRDIKSFNKLAAEQPELEKMPYIAIIIDELADLMMVVGKDVEDSICRIAQKARAAGMHLIVATQRPSVDVITGLIKANIPSRIAFAVSSQVDSRTILDGAGAEKLLGQGDMLFMPVGAPKPTRIQGTFVRDEEISRVLDFIKSSATVQYDEAMIEAMEKHAIQDGKKGRRRCRRRGGRRLRPHVQAGRGCGHRCRSGLHQPFAAPLQAGLRPRRPHHGRDGAKEHHWPLRGCKAPRRAHQPPAVAGNADEPTGGIIKEHYGTFYSPDLHRISSHQPGRHGSPGLGAAGLCGGGR